MAINYNNTVDLNAAKTLFEKVVIFGSRNREYLMNTCRVDTASSGLITSIPLSGQIDMQLGDFSGANIPATTLDKDTQLIGRKVFQIKTAVPYTVERLYEFDELMRHAKAHALALARFNDFLKLQAIFVPAPGKDLVLTNTLTQTFEEVDADVGSSGPSGEGLSVQKLSTATDIMDSLAISSTTMRSLWANPLIRTSLMLDPSFTNWQFNSNRPLPANMASQFLGVDFAWLANVGPTSLPSTTADGVTSFKLPLVDYDAVRVVYNNPPQTTVTPLNHEARTEFLTWAVADSVAVEQGFGNTQRFPGIVIVNCNVTTG